MQGMLHLTNLNYSRSTKLIQNAAFIFLFQYGVVLTLVLLTLCVGFGVSFIFRDEVSMPYFPRLYGPAANKGTSSYKGAASLFTPNTERNN